MTRARALLIAAVLLLPVSNGAHAGDAVRERTLEVVSHEEIVWRAPVRDGEAIDLSFLHSSEKCRWTQHLRVRRAEIEQSASTFACFGAGMPVWTRASARTADHAYTVPAHLRLREIAMVNWRPAAIAIRHRGRAIAIGERLDDWAPFTVRVR